MPKTLTVRYSELATLADCPLKYKLTYASGLIVIPTASMVRGSAFHALMQGHYESFRDDDARKVPRDLARARQRAALRLAEYVKEEGYHHYDDKLRDLLRWMYAGYVERWGTDPGMDKFVVIDQKRVVSLLSHKTVKVSLQVTADLIAHRADVDRWILLDHKTMTQRDASKEAFRKENDLDPQRKLYAACYSLQGLRKGRIPIFGAYHNTIRADQLKREMTLDERFGRGSVFYNQVSLDKAWEEAKELARYAVEIRLGTGRMYSNPNPSECGWKCGFSQIHIAANSSERDIVDVAIKNYGVKQDPAWQPL